MTDLHPDAAWLIDVADTAEAACRADGDNEVYAEHDRRLRQAANTIEALQARLEIQTKALERIAAVPTKEWSIDTAHSIARKALNGERM